MLRLKKDVCCFEVNCTRQLALMKQIMFDDNAMNLFMFSSNGDLNIFLSGGFVGENDKNQTTVSKLLNHFEIEKWDDVFFHHFLNNEIFNADEMLSSNSVGKVNYPFFQPLMNVLR